MPLDPAERAKIQASVDAWKGYSEFAERERRRELRELDENGGPDWEVVADLTTMAFEMGAPKAGSGFVEQQRLFALVRERAGEAER